MITRSVPAAAPEPIRPDFGGRCLTEIVPALLAEVKSHDAGARPTWLPEPVHGAAQVVLLVLDGLGARQLESHRAGTAPTLGSGTGTVVTSVAPSTTATALTSLVTGRPPALHGVVGYRVAVGTEILNVLAWRLGRRDGRQLVPPQRFQPLPPFPNSTDRTPVVSRQDFAATGFTAAHLGDAPLFGWHTAAGLVVQARRLLEAGAPFVYAYYDGLDRTAHAFGLGEHYDAELRAVDRMVGDLVEILPPAAALVVTADHGQVEVRAPAEALGGEVMEAVSLLSGEGRFRWLHARPGAKDDLLAACTERYGDVAWVRDAGQIIEDGWLGGLPGAEVASRLGDVALIPFGAAAFLDPSDTGEQRLVCRHGSLTPDEMYVPLLAWASSR